MAYDRKQGGHQVAQANRPGGESGYQQIAGFRAHEVIRKGPDTQGAGKPGRVEEFGPQIPG